MRDKYGELIYWFYGCRRARQVLKDDYDVLIDWGFKKVMPSCEIFKEHFGLDKKLVALNKNSHKKEVQMEGEHEQEEFGIDKKTDYKALVAVD